MNIKYKKIIFQCEQKTNLTEFIDCLIEALDKKYGFDRYDTDDISCITDFEYFKLHLKKILRELFIGLSTKENITEKDIDSKQLEKGIKIEYEHTAVYDIAKQIALDHLTEIPDYYDRLEKMEKEAEKEE